MAEQDNLIEVINSLQRRVKVLESQAANPRNFSQNQTQVQPIFSLNRGLHDMGNVSACQLYRTANQALAGITKVTWSFTAFDTGGGMADLTNNRINILETGVYYVQAFTTLLVGATDEECQMHIRANSGTGAVFTLVGSSASSSTAMAAILLNASTLWALDSQAISGGPYVELYAGAPGNSLLAGSGQRPTLSVCKVAEIGNLGTKIT